MSSFLCTTDLRKRFFNCWRKTLWSSLTADVVHASRVSKFETDFMSSIPQILFFNYDRQILTRSYLIMEWSFVSTLFELWFVDFDCLFVSLNDFLGITKQLFIIIFLYILSCLQLAIFLTALIWLFTLIYKVARLKPCNVSLCNLNMWQPAAE